MDANTLAIVIGGVGGLIAAVGSLIGVLHLHAKSKCCGKRIEIDIDTATPPTTSPTSATPLVAQDKKIES
jgi:hypothetical protein